MESDFSLVLGGPLYQLFLRTRLARPAMGLLIRRLIFFPLFTWVPPFLVSLWEGTAFGGTSGVTFARDILTHMRFLVALPLFLIAEVVVHQRLKLIVNEFTNRAIIAPADMPRFKSAVNSAMGWRNSVFAELAMLVICFTGGHILWINYSSLKASTWYMSLSPEGARMTSAGWWYAWVSMPVFQFISLRWYYRLFIWARFLWQVSRMPLRLVATHPDRSGGLGFLGFTTEAFMPLIVAQGVLVAGLLGGKILFESAAIASFKIEILCVVVFQLLIMLGPLCVFALPLLTARRRGLGAYGALAMSYAEAFDRKWVRGQAGVGDKILGSADVQSLADMGNSFSFAEKMRLFPFGKESVIQVVVMTLVPLVPFILTTMPLESLISKVLKVVF